MKAYLLSIYCFSHLQGSRLLCGLRLSSSSFCLPKYLPDLSKIQNEGFLKEFKSKERMLVVPNWFCGVDTRCCHYKSHLMSKLNPWEGTLLGIVLMMKPWLMLNHLLALLSNMRICLLSGPVSSIDLYLFVLWFLCHHSIKSLWNYRKRNLDYQ